MAAPVRSRAGGPADPSVSPPPVGASFMSRIRGVRDLAYRGLSLAHAVASARVTVHVLIVILLALGVRLAFLAVSWPDPAAQQMEEDSHGYVTLASNLIDGRGFARAHRIPPDSQRETWLPELARTPGYP